MFSVFAFCVSLQSNNFKPKPCFSTKRSIIKNSTVKIYRACNMVFVPVNVSMFFTENIVTQIERMKKLNRNEAIRNHALA